MDGEKKFIVVVTSIATIGVSLITLIALFILWPYRIWVITGVLSIVVLAVVLWAIHSIIDAKGKINEQVIRVSRVQSSTELPLRPNGSPYYMPFGSSLYPNEEPIRHTAVKNDIPYGMYTGVRDPE